MTTSNLSIKIITWNVGESFPPKDLTNLLALDPPGADNDSDRDKKLQLPDIYVIGLQELKSDTASLISDSLFDDAWTNQITETLWSRAGYVRVKSLRLVGIHISLYTKRKNLVRILNVESEYTRTGFGGLWGSKGAVTIRLEIDHVNICFVNCHFTAHPENFVQRIEDYNQVLFTQKFRDKDSPSILDHDYIFWFGDLNFRLDDVTNEECRKRIAAKDYKYLLSKDQLNNARLRELLLIDFDEGPIDFQPTYKFNYNSSDYDTSPKNRVPSWC
ncbi:hypothetical protein HELRODRAFT_193459, partial [Helobdella robusta]|uniref:Inositol polyphosphate-related phosphatase domain-containing protein n=1 Tax=Helobdella robusta TaxID=6412 RepID=T1FV05_HELRO